MEWMEIFKGTVSSLQKISVLEQKNVSFHLTFINIFCGFFFLYIHIYFILFKRDLNIFNTETKFISWSHVPLHHVCTVHCA